jgi:hypothetical protein
MSALKALGEVGAGACVVLALAGCGGNKKAATTAATSSVAPPATRTVGTPPPVKSIKVKSVTYKVNLAGASGSPAGAPNGSGLAVITVSGINAFLGELCWKFSQLKNVTAPTMARIYSVPTGTSAGVGITLGGGYKSTSCLPEASSFLALLEDHPQGFDVSIDNAQFPNGAVRGQI